jgi:hypothetical protein
MVGTWVLAMPLISHVMLDLLYMLALVGLFLYGLNASILLAIYWWNRRPRQGSKTPEPPAVWPMVTVQLPL